MCWQEGEIEQAHTAYVSACVCGRYSVSILAVHGSSDYKQVMVTARFRFILAVCSLYGLCIGCGAAGLKGREFDNGTVRYRIGRLQSEWKPISVDGSDLSWRNQRDDSLLQISSSCNPRHDIPLRALRGHLLIGFTEREISSEQLVSVDGREALRTELVAKLDGVVRSMTLFVLKKDMCVYDFVLISPSSQASERHRDWFAQFVGDFHTLK